MSVNTQALLVKKLPLTLKLGISITNQSIAGWQATAGIEKVTLETR
ncbi:MAG: hypothetical protein F6K28_26725 [Microcoleus sp. SIO2G3]|nr:hypothetical protein [Microcoleus sp. SIO2G3]